MKTGGVIRAGVTVALILVLIAAIVVALKTARGGSKSIVFPDGSRLKLLGVSKGNEPFTTDQKWEIDARRWLPRTMQSWLKDEFRSSGSSESNSLVMWFILEDSAGANVSSLPWSWYEAIDGEGFRYPMNGGHGSSSVGKQTIHHVYINAFPRRESEFDLRFLDGDSRVITSIRLANPFKGPFATWETKKLPIQQTNSPLVVTLEGVAQKSNRLGIWLAPKWKLETAEASWKNARPGYVEYQDATGNRGGQLSLNESAWKLTMLFRKTAASDYDDSEKFVISNLTVPEDGELQLLQTNVDRLGVNLRVKVLAGAGTLTITNGTNFGMSMATSPPGWSSSSNGRQTVDRWPSTKPFFLVEVGRPDRLDEIRFRLTGQGGKEISIESSGWYGGRPIGSRYYQQKFDATNALGKLTLEVIVSRARLFEFIIDPSEVQRLNATNK